MSDSRFLPEEVEARLRTALEDAYGAPKRGLLAVVAPGRSELAGNHTDHEGGHVLAGAVDRYVYGLFSPNGSSRVRVTSLGYDPVDIDCADLAPREEERGTTAALVRGMAALFEERGFSCGDVRGFDAVMESQVPAGSGLSSSAAFELELAQALNHLWADGSLSPADLALMAQRDECEYFGKPCGLMDQASVALGGIQHMSFADPDHLDSEAIDFDFADAGYALCLVSVGADHSANIDDYAAVPREMQAVAAALGKRRLGELEEADLLARAGEMRERFGDRAVLRSLHYWREDRLVEERVAALVDGEMTPFLALTRASGASSGMYLQNVSCGGTEQPAMVALAVAEELLAHDGAARIHGGGFGGTIQAFVPLAEVERFTQGMESVFGAGACGTYKIDHEGARAQWL